MIKRISRFLPNASRKLSTFKGFTPLLNTIAQIRPDLDEKSSMGTTVKSEIYLTRIIEYAKEKDIELFLIVTPYITNDDDEAVYNRLKEIAGYYDIQFNSTNYYYDEMGLNFCRTSMTICSLNVKTVSKDVYAGHGKTHMAVRE